MRLAVIPARGGSKRIPRKNIRDFCGKPMLAWSIEAALESTCFDQVIVSTDDPEIAELSRHWGASTPFLRPQHLADDHTGTTPVVRHAIEEIRAAGCMTEAVCCIYATAPFVTVDDLKRGLAALEQNTARFAFSVTSFPFPIQRAIRINAEGRVAMFQPEQFLVRSQDLEEAYHDAGQFYWGQSEAWLNNEVIFSSGSVPVIIPRSRVQDIDTLEDWERAEWMFGAMRASLPRR